jgi:prepilin-type processing-associated H-X9-DG protein/prepilin-type N-terminal cleavage/methylation domain-containing protein
MNTSPDRSQIKCAKGFTLVELLVVIGIIGVLVAILLPTLAGARRQAQIAQCASNLRQIAMGCLLRTQDSGGYMPLAGNIVVKQNQLSGRFGMRNALGDSQGKKYTYARAPGVMGSEMPVPLPAAIAPYLGWKNLPYNNWDQLDQALNDHTNIWKMFQCPATGSYAYARKSPNSNDTTLFNQGTMMGITWERHDGRANAQWSTNTDYAINEGVFGFHYLEPDFAKKRLRGLVTKIKNTSNVILFSDAQRRSQKASQFMEDGWITWDPGWVLDGKPVKMGSLFDQVSQVKHPNMLDKVRHRGRMNIVFADGHVELVNINRGALDQVMLLER